MQSWLQRLLRLGTGHDSALWPVLLLLLVVLIPSAGVVWMMRAAMENERLAVRQRLADAYQAQLELAHRHIDERWRYMLARLDAIIGRDVPPRAFAESVTANLVDSVILLDENGTVVYPDGPTAGMVPGEPNDAWRKAEYLEFDTQDPPAAAEAYRAIAASTADPLFAARARQAHARVLARAGDRTGAIQVLQSLSRDTAAVDSSGRSLAADAELRLIELSERDSDEWRQTVASLAKRLNEYDFPMPAEQRRFLMHAMLEADPTIVFNTLSAEDLAAAVDVQQLERMPPGILRPTKLPNTFQVRPPSGRVIALINGPTLQKFVDGVLAEQPFPKGVVAETLGPGQAENTTGDVVDLSLAPLLPGWRLSLSSGDPDSFDAAANERMAFFLWTGVVVVAITAALALLVANMLRAQRGWRGSRTISWPRSRTSSKRRSPRSACWSILCSTKITLPPRRWVIQRGPANTSK